MNMGSECRRAVHHGEDRTSTRCLNHQVSPMRQGTRSAPVVTLTRHGNADEARHRSRLRPEEADIGSLQRLPQLRSPTAAATATSSSIHSRHVESTKRYDCCELPQLLEA
ncbi:MAG: hypothetical protein MZV70_02670 [Desulfobacterales bacterium]|nr:hypothetical protein [Desulfobacterales bacterium]